MHATTTRLVRLLFCLALLGALAAPAAAGHGGDGERFLVELAADGDANVSVTYTYDLESEAEQAAFEELSTNETARERLATRFENRLGTVADAAGNETGRAMTVGDAAVAAETTDGVGTVTLTVRWENLAAVDGDRLTVTEPFASGFEPNRTFAVRAPDGYRVASADPAASGGGDGEATWEAGTSLEGFELTAAPADDTAEGTDADGAGPGAAVAAAALALVSVAAALVARR